MKPFEVLVVIRKIRESTTVVFPKNGFRVRFETPCHGKRDFGSLTRCKDPRTIFLFYFKEGYFTTKSERGNGVLSPRSKCRRYTNQFFLWRSLWENRFNRYTVSLYLRLQIPRPRSLPSFHNKRTIFPRLNPLSAEGRKTGNWKENKGTDSTPK